MKRRIACLALLSLFIGLYGLAIPGKVQSEEIEARLLCLNIGKADCMLLSYGDTHYLIDAGYAHTYAALKTALEQNGIDHLNGVILTHCHQDHEGGLLSLAKSDIQVDAWYAAKIYYTLDSLEHPAVSAAAQRGESVTWLKAGDTVRVGADASFTVLGPIRQDVENENNNSLVLRFTSPAGSILLSGDMKKEEIEDILAAGAFTACDLLKVGHHGDNNATTKDLVRAVQPKAAVILTDSRQEADTPAPSVLKRLMNIGCAVYVTQDAHDALLFTLRGGEVASVQDILWENVPKRLEGLEIAIDVENDTLTITNANSSAVYLENCQLYSTRGDELLSLPKIKLAAGQSYIIGSGKTEGHADCWWDGKKRIWNRSKLDTAILYDGYGRILACTDNGMEE